jgi:hypothetical protein
MNFMNYSKTDVAGERVENRLAGKFGKRVFRVDISG